MVPTHAFEVICVKGVGLTTRFNYFNALLVSVTSHAATPKIALPISIKRFFET